MIRVPDEPDRPLNAAERSFPASSAPSTRPSFGIRRVVWLSSAVGLLLFAALAYAVNARWLAGLDLATTLALQPYARPLLDRLAVVVAFLLSAELCVVYALILGGFLWRRGCGRWSALPLAFVGPVVIEAGLKYVLHQPLVPLAYYRDTPLPLLSLPTPGSFPSGHVVRAAWFAVFGLTLYARRPGARRWAGVLLAFAFVAFVAITRIYLGVHWLSDVLGGAIFGAALALPAAAVESRVLGRT